MKYVIVKTTDNQWLGRVVEIDNEELPIYVRLSGEIEVIVDLKKETKRGLMLSGPNYSIELHKLDA